MTSAWQPITAGDAQLTLSEVASGPTTALRMDYQFKEGGGFVVARRPLTRTMPEEYAVRFRVRGRGMPIALELKLVDPTGRNVWRRVIKDLPLSSHWKRITVESREIEFGWGPAGGGGIAELGSIEFAIVSGGTGEGVLWLADPRIEDAGPPEPPTAQASSELADFPAQGALNGRGWRPDAQDLRPWLIVDSLQPRRTGGLIIDWLPEAPAGGFRLRGSNGGSRWTTLHTAASAAGPRSYINLSATRFRYLRLELSQPAGARLRLQSFEFSRSIDIFWHNVAKAEPRGWHPRWLHREQTLWTPIGTSHGTYCALMNDDGMVEVAPGSFSLEPMLRIGGRLITWADVQARQELLEDCLPVPSVIWQTADWRLRVRAEATHAGVLRVRYVFDNLSDADLPARLYVLIRPFQVTPPWQSFRAMGGVSAVRELAFLGGAVRVDSAIRLVPSPAAAGFGALNVDQGFMASYLSAGELPRNTHVGDPSGFASGAMEFDLSTRARGACEHTVSCLAADVDRGDESAFDWCTKLPLDQWSGHGWAAEAVDAALTATAHVLVTRSGPALQPGPRRYTRSWIRDAAMMSAALLRMGNAREVREFILWYAPHQRADGFVPCCVDRQGTDWLVEHDSHGQLIALIADYHRFTSDRELLEETWSCVEKAVTCIQSLLEPTGLLPISVSHEGYLAQPVHSYWDDFWALRGLRDAVEMAGILGREEAVHGWRNLAGRFEASLFASIEATRAQRGLNFIPGSIEWADFDPTATANALYLFDVPAGLDRQAVDRTFDTYLTEWHAKRSGAVAWTNYTPYEIRIIGAFVRLGRRDAALQLLRFFLSDRRPRPWNQWPEIAWRDPKTPAHLGDLPHTWIAAEYVLALRSLFAYEREADRSLIVAAGLAPEWTQGEGVRVRAMPTSYGCLSYSARRIDAATLALRIDGGIDARLVLRPPLPGPLRSAALNGKALAHVEEDGVTIAHTPAEVIFHT